MIKQELSKMVEVCKLINHFLINDVPKTMFGNFKIRMLYPASNYSNLFSVSVSPTICFTNTANTKYKVTYNLYHNGNEYELVILTFPGYLLSELVFHNLLPSGHNIIFDNSIRLKNLSIMTLLDMFYPDIGKDILINKLKLLST